MPEFIGAPSLDRETTWLKAAMKATGDVMVPFVKALVPAVDIQAGIVTVTPPPGLFEELPDDDIEDAPATDTPPLAE